MRFRTLEIRWHDSKPISSCDFQPRRARSGLDKSQQAQGYRLATAGEDNHVRIWMVHPNLKPAHGAEGIASSSSSARPPNVEYLATLSRHSAAVNVVRFSPNGEFIASAGDDGMIIIWTPSSSPQAATYGSDLSQEDLQHEKEYWKPRTTFRCTQMQVYDLAWSPTGEYLISGSTDNVARVYSTTDGKCVHEIAEHNHYVQGVAWDPLNEYIATQSSDRSMHVYSISTTAQGGFEAHAVGKNSRMPHRQTRTPSAHGGSRPPMFRRESTASDMESVTSDYPVKESLSESGKDVTPLTPAMSAVSTPSVAMFPPPAFDPPSSRRSSFSSQAPGSPSTFSRYGRSPSPMPALPAIRAASPAWTNVKLYGDESYTNFFRRLTFSPDGGLLLTPAGQFEDPSVSAIPALALSEDGTPARGRKSRPTITTSTDHPGGSSSTSSVYIYSRANFARPPIAQLPGHKKASIAVRFAPQLFELRRGVTGPDPDSHRGVLEGGQQGAMDVDIVGPTSAAASSTLSPVRPSTSGSVVSPMPMSAAPSFSMPSPALSAVDMRPPTPLTSNPPSRIPTPTPPTTSPVFALPYRMLYAVVTMDTVTIHDTQQAGPICMLTKLHYDEFTDASWTSDGHCLMLSSRDGYCTIVVFDDVPPAHHSPRLASRLASFAVPSLTPSLAPSSATSPAPTASKKRGAEPPTPAQSVDGDAQASTSATEAPTLAGESGKNDKEPPKKKRRVALTHVSELGP